ncbi:HNH endonuclease [Roseovarius sp. S1116L3]|uniref:HNH endonuclease n=1 Tax=Roseovarius roseus TaxID=3342636 RepID=UPI00372A3F09
MGFSDVTREGVMQAIHEFKQLGEERFLAEYGFGPAKSYHILYEGTKLPSKAIFGVAHGYSGEGLHPFKFSDFSGGEQQVAKPLRKLGFEVVGGQSRNPTWTRDELILALRLYVDFEGNPPGKTSKEIHDLSETLSQLGRKLGVIGDDNYRNANGVYMKMMNFRPFDERYRSQGKLGLKSGGKADAEVWNEFAKDPERLTKAADTILALLNEKEGLLTTADGFDEEDTEAAEGKLVTRVHRTRERDTSIVKRKKAKVLTKNGLLACEACGFDFAEVYGERGDGFIECHHTKPVSELKPDEKTKISDLALLCANCHRMVHARRPWLNLDELRFTLKANN